MTRNQIEYSKLKETQRANLQQEALTRQRDLNTYMLGSRNATETERANRERERQGLISLGESERANRAREALQQLTLDETRRANLEKESQGRLGLQIQGRQLDLQSRDVETRERQLSETERANRERESLSRSQLSETVRHDIQQENINRQGINANYAVGMSGIAQRERESLRNYEVSLGNLSETISHNEETERVSRIQANVARLGRVVDVLKLNEQKRSDIARETETERANRMKEYLGQQEVNLKYVNTAFQGIKQMGDIISKGIMLSRIGG